MSEFLKRRRPTPAMVIAFIALLAALSGTALALPGRNTVDSGDLRKGAVKKPDIGRNAVNGSKVGKNSLTGADVRGLKGADVTDESLTGNDVSESTLGKVPSAAAADTAGAVNTVILFGPISLNEGQQAALFAHGPLSAVARCQDDAAATELNVIVASTEEGSAFGGDDSSGPLAPATPEANRTIEDPGASDAAGAPALAHSDGYDDQFSMVAPSGSAINGTVSSTADGDNQSCRVYGHVQIVR
jgi:hypothetical protein